ncbi:Asp/Glu/hydantoin racemase [Sphaerosporella brunnea]|uniref:Asp/Glu/hydantoin racemase n=1 Tax=Sphaerosporella brunnea TaxID=1250544 RepID=A0A5J5EL74_9PEZI|nr:Asp/Glu/hydantoin racemase [Sphaerosporella brunnea]
MKLLIVNPNSTESMTEALKPVVTRLLPPGFEATYFTGPASSPKSINDAATSTASAEACFPLLQPLVREHDGVLVACYSAHPLVAMLRRVAAPAGVVVVGIMEASVHHALALGDRFAIVTTGAAWEPLLARGVAELLGCDGDGGCARLAGVRGTGVDADRLHSLPRRELERRMAEATVALLRRAPDVDVVCLGCAGMAGLREAVAAAAASEVGRHVAVVDAVEAGTVVLCGLVTVRMRHA